MNRDSVRTLVWVVEIVWLFVLVFGGVVLLVVFDAPAMWLWILLWLMASLVRLSKSVHLLKPNEMAAIYVLKGGHWRTIVTSTYLAANQEDIEEKEEDWTEEEKTIAGDFGNVVFYLWPVYQKYLMPVSTQSIFVHANETFTQGKRGNFPRAPVEIDATVQFRVGPNVRMLAEAFEVFTSEKNLLKEVTYDDPAGHKYTTTLLGQKLQPVVNKLVLEAIRSAAGLFTWGGDEDIVDQKRQLERWIRLYLCEPESALVQGGFLEPLDPDVLTEAAYAKAQPVTGPSALAFDLVLELVRPQPGTEFATAIAAAISGKLAGERAQFEERLRRTGVAEGLERLGETLGIGTDPADRARLMGVFLAEALRDSKSNVSLNMLNTSGGATTLIEALGAFIVARGGVAPPGGAGTTPVPTPASTPPSGP